MFHDADSVGSKSVNGTWTEMIALVSSGVADISVSPIVVTEERSEVIAFTDALQTIR